MAKTKRSKRQPAASPKKLKRSGPLTPTRERKAAAEHLLEMLANAKATRVAADRKANAGIRLTGQQVKAATWALSDVNLGMIAVDELSQTAQAGGDDADSAMTAIQFVAKASCRKLDALVQLLGDSGFGNYSDELAGTPEGLTAAYQRATATK